MRRLLLAVSPPSRSSRRADQPSFSSSRPPGLREQAEALVAQELQNAGGLKDVHERFPEGMVSEEDLFKVRLAISPRTLLLSDSADSALPSLRTRPHYNRYSRTTRTRLYVLLSSLR